MINTNKKQDISIKRPKNVKAPKTFDQLGILVLDGSGSMDEQTVQHISKADAVTSAVNDFFSRFKSSGVRNNFSFAIVNYDDRAIVKMYPTPVKDIDDHGDYNPMAELGGATDISAGLKEAKKIAEDFLGQSVAGGVPKSVVVLVMTDGVDMNQAETISVANSLKSMNGKVQVAGCFFETLGADEDAMKECSNYVEGLCSSPSLFASVSNADELRKFFIASVSEASNIII